jgi:thiol-disulfide isomerase/thioredoxin
MTKTRTLIAVILFFAAGGALFLMANPKTSETAALRFVDNGPAPDFTLSDINGATVKLSEMKGKVVVLNFWATWCGPCRKEIPDFIDMQNEYGKDGLQFIGVALDDGGAAVVKPYADKTKMNYPVLIGSEDVVKKYGGMNAIPVTVLIDRKGNMRARYVGMRTRAVLESMVLPLLKEK